MEELLELIYKDIANNPKPLIENGQIMRSGVIKENRKTGMVEELTMTSVTKEWVTAKEFAKMNRNNPPINNNILMVWDGEERKTLLCDLSNKEIEFKVKRDYKLFPIIDRIVQYMLSNSIESVMFDPDGVFVRGKGNTVDLERDVFLEKYNEQQISDTITYEAVEYSDMASNSYKSGNPIDLSISIQGSTVRVMKWSGLSKGDELSIRIENPEIPYKSKLGSVFRVEKGTIMMSRSLVQSIPHLVGERKHKRIAFKGFGPLNIKEPHVYCNYFGDETSIEELRSRDYNIYVINIERLDDYKELLSLPSNKLCILSFDFNNVSKSINSIKNLYKNSSIVKSQVMDNLLAIVAGTNSSDYVLMDDWSRELMGYETDLEKIMQKLEEPFLVRDDIEFNKEINIKKEIKMILAKAKEVGASNIDICPGSPIRLYQTKTRFVSYSSKIMTPNLVEIMLLNMVTPSEISKIYEDGELDTSYSVPDVGRYRIGAVRQRSSLAVSVRKVPTEVPSPEVLNLPLDFVEDASSKTKGFTLIVGEPNSGKTVTFNCLIDRINRQLGGVIFLMGSPIEYTHRHVKSLVIQVEVGKDLPSYSQGIAKSLRMNTSVLGFEELRTKEEFGALGALMNAPNSVFLTMHGPSCRKGVENLVRRLSETGISERKAQEDVANALNYVLYQKLVEYNGKRVLIYEKMKATKTIKNLIRQGNYQQIDNSISSEEGCEPLDRVILKRLQEGKVSFDSVKTYVNDKKLFENRGYKF